MLTLFFSLSYIDFSVPVGCSISLGHDSQCLPFFFRFLVLPLHSAVVFTPMLLHFHTAAYVILSYALIDLLVTLRGFFLFCFFLFRLC